MTVPETTARLRQRINEYQRLLASGMHLTDEQMTHYHQLCDALDNLRTLDPARCTHDTAQSGDNYCSQCGAPLAGCDPQTARIAAAIMERIGATESAMGVHIAHSRAEADALVRCLRERWQTDGVQDQYEVAVQEGATPDHWSVIAAHKRRKA